MAELKVVSCMAAQLNTSGPDSLLLRYTLRAEILPCSQGRESSALLMREDNYLLLSVTSVVKVIESIWHICPCVHQLVNALRAEPFDVHKPL